jgi:hypothetical protein
MEHRIVNAYRPDQLDTLSGQQRAELVPVELDGQTYYRPMNRNERRARKAHRRKSMAAVRKAVLAQRAKEKPAVPVLEPPPEPTLPSFSEQARAWDEQVSRQIAKQAGL